MNETGTVSKRIEWVDIAKGFAIILVCLGHRDIPTDMRVWIYSFHMPFFFFLAGYTTNFESYANFRSYATRKIRVLLVPYFVLGLANVAFSFCFNYFTGHGSVHLGDAALHLLDGSGGGPLWFILVLFVVEIVSYAINLLPKWKTFVVILSSFGGYALGLTFSTSHIFWKLDAALISLFFFWFARIVRISRINQKIAKGDVALFFGALIVHAVSLAFNSTFNSGTVLMGYYERRYGIFPLFLLEGAAGSIIVALGCVRLEKSRYVKRVLTYFGKNTFPIVAFHYYPGFMILETVFYKLFNLPYMHNVFSYNIEGFVYTICVLLLIVPIIEITNRFAPWVVGKRILK